MSNLSGSERQGVSTAHRELRAELVAVPDTEKLKFADSSFRTSRHGRSIAIAAWWTFRNRAVPAWRHWTRALTLIPGSYDPSTSVVVVLYPPLSPQFQPSKEKESYYCLEDESGHSCNSGLDSSFAVPFPQSPAPLQPVCKIPIATSSSGVPARSTAPILRSNL